MSKNKYINNLLLHIKYPYTALIIATMWISIAIIISIQQQPKYELLVIITAICTIFISAIGFKSPK